MYSLYYRWKFAPNIVIDITYYLFEADQKLVRSRSNYFAGRTTQILQIFFCSIVIDGDRTTLLTADNAPLFIRLLTGLKLLLIVFQSYQDDCWMIMNDSVRDASYVRDLNIASSEYRTDDNDLGRANRSAAWTTLLLLNFFAGRGSSVGCASAWYAALSRIPSSRPANILMRRLVMKKFLRPFSPFRWFKKDSCQLLAKECALTIMVYCLGGLPGNSVDRLTDRARNDLKSVESP